MAKRPNKINSTLPLRVSSDGKLERVELDASSAVLDCSYTDPATGESVSFSVAATPEVALTPVSNDDYDDTPGSSKVVEPLPLHAIPYDSEEGEAIQKGVDALFAELNATGCIEYTSDMFIRCEGLEDASSEGVMKNHFCFDSYLALYNQTGMVVSPFEAPTVAEIELNIKSNDDIATDAIKNVDNFINASVDFGTQAMDDVTEFGKKFGELSIAPIESSTRAMTQVANDALAGAKKALDENPEHSKAKAIKYAAIGGAILAACVGIFMVTKPKHINNGSTNR